MTYDTKKDTFIYNAGQKLELKSIKPKKDPKREEKNQPLEIRRIYYNTQACKNCPYQDKCTPPNQKHRIITDYRSPEILKMKYRMNTTEAKEKYKKRASTGKPPIRTIKQQKKLTEIPVTGIKEIENRLNIDVHAYDLKQLHRLLHEKNQKNNSKIEKNHQKK